MHIDKNTRILISLFRGDECTTTMSIIGSDKELDIDPDNIEIEYQGHGLSITTNLGDLVDRDIETKNKA